MDMHLRLLKSTWRSSIRLRETSLSVFIIFGPTRFHTSSTMQKFNRDRISSNEIESSSISLSEAEETFRRLLIDVVEFIQKKPISATAIRTPASLSNEPLELRWTGG